MTEQSIELARLVPTLGSGNEDQEREVIVHFNPASLQYEVTNTLEDSKGNDKKQYVSKSVGKLTMDLIFDTTHDGQDVRNFTEKIARFMEPDAKKAPPVIVFEWGKYRFQGMVESFKETIDFFASSGVPLRSSVNLVMSRQDKVFEPTDTSGTADTSGALDFDAVEAPSGSGQDASSVAARGGNPRAARSIASANGLETTRFSSGPVTVSGSISLSGPVAFASGGAGIGVGGGAGLGIGAGGGVGIGASVSASAFIGGQASAGVSASAGAFAGLRAATGGKKAALSLDTGKLVKGSVGANLSTSGSATFGIGGQARGQGSASLGAEVGVNASLRARIQFEDEPA